MLDINILRPKAASSKIQELEVYKTDEENFKPYRSGDENLSKSEEESDDKDETKDEDSEEREIPRGTRMQGVMCSRFGDIGFTLDLGPEASGYIIRLDPFSSNLKDIRNTP